MAVLGLLALFTHIHLFWVIGLLLAMIDLPDFGTPLRRIAGSVEKIAGIPEAKIEYEYCYWALAFHSRQPLIDPRP